MGEPTRPCSRAANQTCGFLEVQPTKPLLAWLATRFSSTPQLLQKCWGSTPQRRMMQTALRRTRRGPFYQCRARQRVRRLQFAGSASSANPYENFIWSIGPGNWSTQHAKGSYGFVLVYWSQVTCVASGSKLKKV